MLFYTRNFLNILLILFISQTAFSQNGLDFDGINDQIDCGNAASVEISGTTITLEAWIYPTSWTNEVWRGNIINKGDAGATGYMLRAGNNGRLNFNLGNGIAWTETSSNANELTLNTWQHVAATYDGAMMRTYVNGIPVDSLATTISLANATNSNLGIGVDMAFARYFPGAIDEVRIWDTQRTEQEIINSMNTELCPQNGLKAYYQLNAGVAGGANTAVTTIADLSGNGNTGTLTGFTLTGATSNWITGATLAPSGPSSGVDVQSPPCNTFTWVDGITYTADNNTATFTLPNISGCDSVVTLNLTIGTNQSTTSTDVQTACGVLQWIDGNFYTTNNNTATYTIPNAAGCDSIITLDLTISGGTTGTDVQTACSAFTWINGNTYTSSNNSATFTIPNANGCDSTITLNLTITTIETTDTRNECGDSFTWIDGITYTTSNSNASFLLQAADGCDSLVNLDLTLTELDLSITVSQVSLLTANEVGASYQWLDCNNNFAPITGPDGTNKFFPVFEVGSYAVEITKNGCTDVSDCVNITTLSIDSDKNISQQITLYPNPSSGQVALKMPLSIETGIVSILDLNGKIVYSQPFTNTNQPLSFELSLASGMYFIDIQSENYNGRLKLIKH